MEKMRQPTLHHQQQFLHHSGMHPQQLVSVYQSLQQQHSMAMPTASATGSASSSKQYQSTELILYGSIKSGTERDELLQRLSGLCDPGSVSFQEHNMCFKLKTGNESSPVAVQMRRHFHGVSQYWHCRYIGLPETADPKCPVVVRKTIDSTMHCTNMMEFVKTLGLRMEYEFIAKGRMFTKGLIRVMVYKLVSTDVTGQYTTANLKPLTDSHLVEAIIILPDGGGGHVGIDGAARQLRDFCNQLVPLCDMQNINYMMD